MDTVFAKRQKRKKILVTAIVITFANYFIHQRLFESGIQVWAENILRWVLLLGIGIGVWWFLTAVKQIRVLLCALIPVYLYTFVSELLLTYNKIADDGWVYVFIGIGYYLIFLTVNLLYVAKLKEIPLKKAGLSSLFFIGLMIFIIWAYLIMMQGWGISFSLLAFWLGLVLYILSYFGFVSDQEVYVETVVYGLLSGEMLLVSNFWNANSYTAILGYTGLLFIMIAVFQNYLQKDLTRNVLREYALISVLLIAAVLFYRI